MYACAQREPPGSSICSMRVPGRGSPGQFSVSTKYASGKYLQQVGATEVSRKADEMRARKIAEESTTLKRGNQQLDCSNQEIIGKVDHKGAGGLDMGTLGGQDTHTHTQHFIRIVCLVWVCR